MKYRVTAFFTDLQDGNHPYDVGDTYPRKGLKPTAERIEELSTDKNLRGVPLIEAAEQSKTAPDEAEA